ncbi:MAG: hypothetical protein GC206_03755 [Alphaproteobacteria bacterium]|nr:hypothetical protein [Alphaproteobacteria bacterium]
MSRSRRVLHRFARRPNGREARNEQRKALAAVFNALAIALIVTGLIGPAINPSLEPTLDVARRVGLVLSGVAAHLVVRAILWSVEDK